MMTIMSMGWDYVSRVRSWKGLLFIPKMIYEYGEAWWNDTDLQKHCNKNSLFELDFVFACIFTKAYEMYFLFHILPLMLIMWKG
jgi:hypothetical protein